MIPPALFFGLLWLCKVSFHSITILGFNFFYFCENNVIGILIVCIESMTLDSMNILTYYFF